MFSVDGFFSPSGFLVNFTARANRHHKNRLHFYNRLCCAQSETGASQDINRSSCPHSLVGLATVSGINRHSCSVPSMLARVAGGRSDLCCYR